MQATVIVPTHDHGAMLRLAVRSALAQTVTDLEVIVIGDGATEETHEVATALAREEERVRYLSFPKGPRLGEAYRHGVLCEEARGECVLYLSDDDVWFPEHAERLLELLEAADFAHALALWNNPDGAVQMTTLDIAVAFHREAVISGRQVPGLTTAGHTLAAYRRLPYGWRTTPEGVGTDSWMWRQFLAQPWCRAVSGKVPTFVHLPSPGRRHMSLAERLEEQQRYDALGRDPLWRRAYCEGIVEQLIDECAWFWAHADHLERWGADLAAQLTEVWADRGHQWEGRVHAEQELAEARAALATAEARLAGIRRSRAYRAGQVARRALDRVGA